ncbi:MAG: DUF4440 domain-containing protein [Chitinophagaceae bacterium]|nr:DUF4440 domain-containing protein [Chitinophagaceae bacterium]
MRNVFFVLFTIITAGFSASAQSSKQELTDTILHKDSAFWKAYNECDADGFRKFFADDVEFYHDKGGLTLGGDDLLSSFKNNLCSNSHFRLRREAVEGSVKVFPLEKNNVIYGAILSGEHIFYIIENGSERPDGQAKFTHVWLLKNNNWKMERVLSYDHGPVAYTNRRKEITLPDKILQQYAGTYTGPQTGKMSIKNNQGKLTLQIGEKKFILYPETENRFFSKERDLVFEFVTDAKKQPTKMIVYERGVVVEEAIFKNK